jgi:hypothetical protein
MLKFLLSPRAAELGSALLVIVASWIVGRYAADGFTPTQWACGVFAILGSISVAVMVRIWPAPQKVEASD